MTNEHRRTPAWHQQPLVPAQPLTPCVECRGDGSWWQTEVHHGWRERQYFHECEHCGGSGWEPESEEEAVPPIREGGPFDGRYIPPSDEDGFSLHNPGASLPGRLATTGGVSSPNAQPRLSNPTTEERNENG